MKEKIKTQVWYKGEWQTLQDMSLEEQEDFWKEIEENAQHRRKHNYIY